MFIWCIKERGSLGYLDLQSYLPNSRALTAGASLRQDPGIRQGCFSSLTVLDLMPVLRAYVQKFGRRLLLRIFEKR